MKISSSFRRKPEYRRPAGMPHSRLWIPAFAGMTEMDQTMIKAKNTINQSRMNLKDTSPFIALKGRINTAQGSALGIRRIALAAVIIISHLIIPPASFADTHRNLKDQTGRIIRVSVRPQRVVSLAPSITEIIFDLKKEKQLVGVTQFSDYPAEAHQFPKVGSYVKLDLEKIVSLNPDLCIAVKDGNPIAIVKRLENLNIPVFAVDPRNLESVMEAIRYIGSVLNADDQAEALTIDMAQRIGWIKQQAAQTSHRPGVFFQIGISPIVAVGRSTFIHELIVTAGGKNLSEGDTPYPRYSREQVLALAPEILIVTSMARGQIFEQVKKEWEQWPDLPAVRKKQIYLVDSDLFDRPTPRMVDGLEYLFYLIHPEMKGSD